MKLITLAALPAVVLASCNSPSLIPEAHHVPQKDKAVERSVHRKINQYRASKGLQKLNYEPLLADIARKHSRDMTRNHRPNKLSISHDGFLIRARAARYVGMGRVAENVGAAKVYNSDPATRLVNGWIASKGHHRNLTGDYDTTGVGVYSTADGAYYATQLFGHKKVKPFPQH